MIRKLFSVELVDKEKCIEELVNLFNLCFSDDISINYWKWKHLYNPYSKIDSKIVLALEGNKIIGARPLLLTEFIKGGKCVLAAQPCDTMVHPDYRRQGIFKKMNDLAIEYSKEIGVSFFYNFPGWMSRTGYLKQGWRNVCSINKLYLLIRPDVVFANKLNNPLITFGVSFFYSKLKNKSFLENIPKNFQLKSFYRYPSVLKKIDKLYTNEYSGQINLNRNESFLKWRLDNNPKFHYRYLLFFYSGNFIGYSVVQINNDENNVLSAKIMDFLILENNYYYAHLFLRSVIKYLIKKNCVQIYAWEPQNTNLCKVYSLLEFKSYLKFPYSLYSLFFKDKGIYLYYRLIDSKSTFSYNSDNWQLTPIHLDCI